MIVSGCEQRNLPSVTNLATLDEEVVSWDALDEEEEEEEESEGDASRGLVCGASLKGVLLLVG